MSKVKLVSSDEVEFEVEKKIAQYSRTITSMLEDLDVGEKMPPIPLPNVTGKILKKVIEYCEYHEKNPQNLITEEKEDDETKKKKSEDIIPWDKDFCNVEQSVIFELILAANYLDIKPLLDLTCQTVANIIKGKTPEEIRKVFKITREFTPEEEEIVRKENGWCNER